jgi:hypothetical protein
MRVTDIAIDFHPVHSPRPVIGIADGIFLDGLCKAGPAGPRIELDRRVEKRCIAADTIIFAGFIAAAQLTAESPLGPMLPGDTELFRRKKGLPFRICLFDPSVGCRIALVGKVENVIPVQHIIIF